MTISFRFEKAAIQCLLCRIGPQTTQQLFDFKHEFGGFRSLTFFKQTLMNSLQAQGSVFKKAYSLSLLEEQWMQETVANVQAQYETPSLLKESPLTSIYSIPAAVTNADTNPEDSISAQTLEFVKRAYVHTLTREFAAQAKLHKPNTLRKQAKKKPVKRASLFLWHLSPEYVKKYRDLAVLEEIKNYPVQGSEDSHKAKAFWRGETNTPHIVA